MSELFGIIVRTAESTSRLNHENLSSIAYTKVITQTA